MTTELEIEQVLPPIAAELLVAADQRLRSDDEVRRSNFLMNTIRRSDILMTFGSEIKDMPRTEKLKAAGRLALFLGVQGLGASQLPVASVMTESFRTFGHQPLEGIGVAAAAVGSWAYLDATTSNYFFNGLPNTAEAVGKSWLGKASNSLLIGGDPDPPELVNTMHDGLFESRGFRPGKFFSYLGMGLTTQGTGTAPYFIKASRQRQTKEEKLGLRDKLGQSSAVFWGALTGGITLGANLAINQDPALGNQVMHYLKEPGVWFGLAFAISSRNIPFKDIAKTGVRKAASLMRLQRAGIRERDVAPT